MAIIQPHAIYTPVVFISGTRQFNQFLAIFIGGIDFLQHSDKGATYSASTLATLADTLFNTAKLLTTFLGYLTTLQFPPYDWRPQRSRRLRTTWLRRMLIDVRIQFHRYSLVVLEMARGRKLKNKLWAKEAIALLPD